METRLFGFGLGLVVVAAVVGLVLLLALDIGLGLATEELWDWIKRHRKRRPRFPWSDRTGT